MASAARPWEVIENSAPAVGRATTISKQRCGATLREKDACSETLMEVAEWRKAEIDNPEGHWDSSTAPMQRQQPLRVKAVSSTGRLATPTGALSVGATPVQDV